MNHNTWKEKGSISIWRYIPLNKNFPGWHMSADMEGYDCLLNLIDLLKTSPIGSKRTIKLSEPNVWLASTKLKKTGERKVVLSLTEPDTHWELVNNGDKLFFGCGLKSLLKLESGILRAKSGEYDFSIGGTNGQNLWFW